MRYFITVSIVFIALLGILNLYKLAATHAATANPEIRSAIAGYCLDDHHDSAAPNAAVDSWTCNGTAAQDWTVSGDSIKHDDNRCLEAQSGGEVVLNSCNGSSGQQWAVDQGGFQNPASGLCLTVPEGKTDKQLIAAGCGDLSRPDEAWSAGTWSDPSLSSPACVTGTKGQQVACYARQQWAAWQAGSPSHKTLLADYTDGNGYEQWCADFVSYVYKEAGYPFENGERDGWDEYDANNVQNMGFTVHPAASGYVPKPGDVAFFDYPGGHVEIVVSGGKTPTFIYGDSGTTDPGTGNGEMNEDMLSNDGSAGQVTYYLSPN